MSNPIFQNILSRYSMRTKDERSNATHEVMQQIALAGLYKSGFFNKAAFYAAYTDKLEEYTQFLLYILESCRQKVQSDNVQRYKLTIFICLN